MHVLPRVREIHERYESVLSVVGVHAGKFITERKTERIAEACDRLNVTHPVVNDRQFRVWRDFAVNAWPTVAVIDPEGYVAFVEPGEFDIESMAGEIGRIVERARAKGTLVEGPDPFPARVERHEGPLRFPSRAIVADGHLWVSDLGHGRVLECGWDPAAASAEVLAVHDGFVEPRGLAASDGRIYVADRAGHSVWEIAFGEKRRIAGTGRIGERMLRPGVADAIDLRSPWGLATHAGKIAVAMAGSHQLWDLDPDAGTLAHIAGTGGEALVDGDLVRAALAQPTGVVALPDGALASADCESSAARTVDAHGVRTIVGTGLFDFGDRPGYGDDALLQHCEDVAHVGEGALAVADTYNDRLKRVDRATRSCVPWPGEAGEAGALREPDGVWSDGTTTIVADTGHHRLVRVAPDGTLTEVRLV